MERRPQGSPLREAGMERHDVGGGRAVREPLLRGRMGTLIEKGMSVRGWFLASLLDKTGMA